MRKLGIIACLLLWSASGMGQSATDYSSSTLEPYRQDFSGLLTDREDVSVGAPGWFSTSRLYTLEAGASPSTTLWGTRLYSIDRGNVDGSRRLGICTGSAEISVVLGLINKTGADIRGVNISYMAELWCKKPVSTLKDMAFGYTVTDAPNTLVSSIPATLKNPLAFALSSAKVGEAITISGSLVGPDTLPIYWPADKTLWLRWTASAMSNAVIPMLGDVVVSPVPEPTVAGTFAVVTLAALSLRKRKPLETGSL